MPLRTPLRLPALVLRVAVIGLLACTGPTREAPPAPEAPAAPAAASEEPPALEDGPDPIEAMQEAVRRASALTCEAAQRCCEAYVEAMGEGGPDAEEACAGVRASTASQLTCQAAMQGWVTVLREARGSVPAACSGE